MQDRLYHFANVNPDPDMKWIARMSLTGRGLRLHQSPIHEWAGHYEAFDTPEEAIDHFLKKHHKAAA